MKTAWMLSFSLPPILCFIGLLPEPASASSIVAIRSEQSSLPESIRREAFAAIDRSRETLLALGRRDGLWTLQDGSSTVFPALAFCDPDLKSQADVVATSVATSLKQIEASLSKPWSQTQAKEASYTALAAMMNVHQTIEPRVRARLSRVQPSTMKCTESALLLMALEANGFPINGGWQAVVNNLRLSPESDITSVAVAALGRLKSKQKDLGRPHADVLAHVRWIARRFALDDNTPLSGDTDPLTPEAAFFITVLASQLPRQVLAEDSTLFPISWRNHLANRLLAQQRKDPSTGLDYWDTASSPAPSSDSAMRATTYAVMTLVILAE